MITIEGLSKVYKNKYAALQDIDLVIGTGMFGLLGLNGAGKTTLMRIIATLLHPTSGEVQVHGFSLTKQPEKIREMIGYFPQQFQIYPQLTAIEFLDYVIVDEPTAGLDPEERVRFRNLLARLSIDRTIILSTHIVGGVFFEEVVYSKKNSKEIHSKNSRNNN
ncbi:ATP-binding cassette domain-containing protein [Tepidibacillus marianensis]|uniref:ATP-binding cassette domain-containing protein n=1 Tax=Tepidibacillus marianensis TaxID=3131995 RepID=UPI0030D4DBC2